MLEGHNDEILGLGVAAAGESLLSVSRDRTVNVWRSKLPVTPRLATIDDVDVRLWTLAVSADGRALFAGGRDGLLAAWSVQTGQRIATFEGFEGTIDAVTLTSDGEHIACCGWREEKIVIFNTLSAKQTIEIEVGAKVRCVCFSPDDRYLVAGTEEGAFTVWDWNTGDEVRSIKNNSLPVYDLAFSPNGAQLAVGRGEWREPTPGDVTFWNSEGWSETHKRNKHTRAVRAVAFDPLGTRAASAGEDGLVILWHPETHVALAQLRNSSGARPLAFSPDGTHLAVGLHDGTINLWNIAQEDVVQRFQSEDDVFGLSYSRDGSVLFSVSGEERIEIWPVAAAASTAEQISHWPSNKQPNAEHEVGPSP